MTRISFGILALNAQPFLEYNLQALYPFAHQILVVEGATRPAAKLSTPGGHSVDGTIEMLKTFQQQFDPEHKVQVVSAVEDGYADGFWPEKDEMSRAYAKRATGDWLWQVDSDEFYLTRDIKSIIHLLEHDPTITAVSFPYVEFFASFSTCITGVWHVYEHPRFHRLFRWGKGYVYKSHRPPTVLNDRGVDLRTLNWIRTPYNEGRSIRLYHYSYVLPKQIKQKVGYYVNVDWTDAFKENEQWMEEEYFGIKHPMFLGERRGLALQWLEGYSGMHPEAIEQLRSDLETGKVKERLRATDDIEHLLASPFYHLERLAARIFLAVFWPIRQFWKRLRAQLLVKSSTASKIP